MTTILIIEDEHDIRDMIYFALEPQGFRVIQADTASKAFDLLKSNQPDLILADWMLPGTSGIQFIRKIKKQPDYKNIPIIMLTAKAEEFSKVEGLESGADDYITKPFSIKELIARIRSVLRRANPIQENGYEIYDPKLAVGIREKGFYHQEQLIKLTRSEFLILEILFKFPHKIFSRDELLEKLNGVASESDERAIDAAIKRVRKRLAAVGLEDLISTVRGFGYRWNQSV